MEGLAPPEKFQDQSSTDVRGHLMPLHYFDDFDVEEHLRGSRQIETQNIWFLLIHLCYANTRNQKIGRARKSRYKSCSKTSDATDDLLTRTPGKNGTAYRKEPDHARCLQRFPMVGRSIAAYVIVEAVHVSPSPAKFDSKVYGRFNANQE